MTFLESRKTIPNRRKKIELETYPSTTIIVPCYNEENTIEGTILSLLKLDYPKDKLQIMLVDDGSTDKTLEIMRSYEKNDQIKVLHQKNAGKHTALNLAIGHVTTELIGSLDADSFVDPYALQRIAHLFQQDKEIMSVVSSILIHKPKNWLQQGQKAEYEISIFIKNMLASMGALHVTPGPFSLFRKEVFAQIGPYRAAYNTEDCEMALRMHKNGLKIAYCADSYVYTVAPDTTIKLFKQRVRWIYGFLKNLYDYREMLFKPKYGNLSFFTFPSAIISFIGVSIISIYLIVQFIRVIVRTTEKVSVVGIDSMFSFSKMNMFSISFTGIVLLTVILYAMVFLGIFIGRRMGQQKMASFRDIISFVILSAVMAPFWIIKSMYNAVLSRQSAWK